MNAQICAVLVFFVKRVVTFCFVFTLFQLENDLVAAEENYQEMGNILVEEFEAGQAIILGNQNHPEKIVALVKAIKQHSGLEQPIIEFLKINPAKYYLRVHKINSAFFLIFSETFHEGWKVYPLKLETPPFFNQKKHLVLNEYKTLEGNEEYQANVNEVKEFIQQGWISSLGDGQQKKRRHYRFLENDRKIFDHNEIYTINFISKITYNTIQNNNFIPGPFYETWGKNHLDEIYHLKTNGYANGWLIDLESLKKNFPNALIANKDGSFELKLILEFSPQKLLYFCLGVSAFTFFSSFLYILYFFIKRTFKPS